MANELRLANPAYQIVIAVSSFFFLQKLKKRQSDY